MQKQKLSNILEKLLMLLDGNYMHPGEVRENTGYDDEASKEIYDAISAFKNRDYEMDLK